jgi:hypothetical protein
LRAPFFPASSHVLYTRSSVSTYFYYLSFTWGHLFSFFGNIIRRADLPHQYLVGIFLVFIFFFGN